MLRTFHFLLRQHSWTTYYPHSSGERFEKTLLLTLLPIDCLNRRGKHQFLWRNCLSAQQATIGADKNLLGFGTKIFLNGSFCKMAVALFNRNLICVPDHYPIDSHMTNIDHLVPLPETEIFHKMFHTNITTIRKFIRILQGVFYWFLKVISVCWGSN